ncbi:nudix hydrolase 13, mitochondrial-like isoform X3 [Mercurialis annua]|uniref:nudix hydrolase 13, mitochondrial-like isoform X3 n=1 Tax=Mercurialis annua TaxID=3986 RepID=UPI00215DD574|nr:nudix hydrolase 13, mitochondrial-like isoform X3 [Mercurialis annua]
MSSLLARTGRHRQRYQGHLRLVAGCIPYKIEKKNIEDGNCKVEESILVLMISTPKREDLVFPKENPLGAWEFRSKSSEKSSSLIGGCRGYMFALEVTQELHCWPGQSNYSRKWVSCFDNYGFGFQFPDLNIALQLTTEEAFKLCRYDWMKEALQNLLDKLGASGSRGSNVW